MASKGLLLAVMGEEPGEELGDTEAVMTHPVVRALGWFSIGLGVLELVAPGALARAVGLKPRANLVRGAYGARELLAGAGILRAENKAPYLWSRVAGDVVDVGTLSYAALRGERRLLAAGALAAIAAITYLDLQAAVRA